MLRMFRPYSTYIVVPLTQSEIIDNKKKYYKICPKNKGCSGFKQTFYQHLLLILLTIIAYCRIIITVKSYSI